MRERQYKYIASHLDFDGRKTDYDKIKSWARSNAQSFWETEDHISAEFKKFTFCATPDELQRAKRTLDLSFHALSCLDVAVDIEGIPVQKEME